MGTVYTLVEDKLYLWVVYILLYKINCIYGYRTYSGIRQIVFMGTSNVFCKNAHSISSRSYLVISELFQKNCSNNTY